MHKSLLSKLGLGLAAVMWLAGCAPAFSEDEEQGPEAAPDIGSVESAVAITLFVTELSRLLATSDDRLLPHAHIFDEYLAGTPAPNR